MHEDTYTVVVVVVNQSVVSIKGKGQEIRLGGENESSKINGTIACIK